MTRIETEPLRIQISAPDGPAAFALERRVAHLRPVTIGVDGDWSVELEDPEGRLDEIEAAVRGWLRDWALASTMMTVNGLPHHVEAASPRVREPLGAGYDGPDVLAHEP